MFTIEVTDSRGRKTSKDVTVVVQAYASPTLRNSAAFRCDQFGNELIDRYRSDLKAQNTADRFWYEAGVSGKVDLYGGEQMAPVDSQVPMSVPSTVPVSPKNAQADPRHAPGGALEQQLPQDQVSGQPAPIQPRNAPQMPSEADLTQAGERMTNTPAQQQIQPRNAPQQPVDTAGEGMPRVEGEQDAQRGEYKYTMSQDEGMVQLRTEHRERNSDIADAEYNLGLEMAYAAGKYGWGDAALENSVAVKTLSPETIKEAFDSGKLQYTGAMDKAMAASKDLMSKLPKRGAGRVTFRDGWNMKDGTTAEQRDFARLLSNYGKVMGFDIEVYKSVADDQGLLQGEHGSFDRATGKLVFDINAGAMTVQEVAKASLPVTMAHELTHYLKMVMPVEFRQFQQTVLNGMAERGTDIDALLKRQMDLAPNALDMDALVEEVIADASSMMLQDSTAMEQIAVQNPGLFRSIMDWLSDFIQRIKTNLSKLDATMPGAEALLEMKDGVLRVAEQYQQTWDKMMVGADSKRAEIEKQRTAKPALAAKGQGIQAVAYDDGQLATPAQKPGKVAQNAPAEVIASDVRDRNKGVTFTPDNKPMNFHYALVPVNDLVTSNNPDMTVNDAYPAELQPRDRSRAASRDQVEGIARRLNPELLGESVKASDGAPIVGSDLVVEAGNGRVMALRLAQLPAWAWCEGRRNPLERDTDLSAGEEVCKQG